jgi:hypothetical protein
MGNSCGFACAAKIDGLWRIKDSLTTKFTVHHFKSTTRGINFLAIH